MGLREWFGWGKKAPSSPGEGSNIIGAMGYVTGYCAGFTEAMIHSRKGMAWPSFDQVKEQAAASVPPYLRGPDA